MDTTFTLREMFLDDRPTNHLRLDELIGRIEHTGNREACLSLLFENGDRLALAWGSSHNHQAWTGGYLAHVIDVMNTAVILHPALSSYRPLPFTASDALVVLFLHDIEKPWRRDPKTGELDETLRTKGQRERFRLLQVAKYEFTLTQEQHNALKYVEGEGDDYSPTRRVMNELAAFCHLCDVASARIWHDCPPQR